MTNSVSTSKALTGRHKIPGLLRKTCCTGSSDGLKAAEIAKVNVGCGMLRWGTERQMAKPGACDSIRLLDALEIKDFIIYKMGSSGSSHLFPSTSPYIPTRTFSPTLTLLWSVSFHQPLGQNPLYQENTGLGLFSLSNQGPYDQAPSGT